MTRKMKREYEKLVQPKWTMMSVPDARALKIHPNVFYANAEDDTAVVEVFGKADGFTLSEAVVLLFKDQSDYVTIRLVDGSGNVQGEAVLTRVIDNLAGHQANLSTKGLGNYYWIDRSFEVSDIEEWRYKQAESVIPTGEDKLSEIIDRVTLRSRA